MPLATYPHKVKMPSLWDPLIQLDWHDGIFLMPPAPLPAPGKSCHLGISFLWMSEISLGGDPKKNSETVLADGAYLSSRGAKVGGLLILPHINLYPLPVSPNLNLLIPLLILGSSSKCMFAASTVQGPDGAIACSVLPHVGFNLACAQPAKMPTSIIVTRGTVQVGFTFGDFLYGFALMVVEIGVDYALGKLCGKASDRLMGSLNRSSILKSTLRPGMNRALRVVFGRGYSYAQAGKQGFQSLADKYLSTLIKKGIKDYPGKAGVNLVGLDSGSIVNWMAGGDESF